MATKTTTVCDRCGAEGWVAPEEWDIEHGEFSVMCSAFRDTGGGGWDACDLCAKCVDEIVAYGATLVDDAPELSDSEPQESEQAETTKQKDKAGEDV
jgi:hypothetical protein